MAFAEGTGPTWLVLGGTFGAGKTHLAMAVRLRLFDRLAFEIPVLSDVLFFYVPRLWTQSRPGSMTAHTER